MYNYEVRNAQILMRFLLTDSKIQNRCRSKVHREV